MQDEEKSKAQLIQEINQLRRRVAALEVVKEECGQAVIALEKSEMFLNTILNALDDPLFVKDHQHRWVLLNNKFCKLMGVTREKLIGTSIHNFLPAEHADIFRQTDELVLRSGKTIVNEKQFTRNQQIQTISTKKSLFIDPITGQKFIVGIMRDITSFTRVKEALLQAHTDSEERVTQRTAELSRINMALRQEISQRQEAQESLSKTARRFQALIENATDVFAILDDDNIFRYISPSAERVLGYRSENIIGKSLFELTHPDDLLRATDILTHDLRLSTTPVCIELRIQHPNGSWRIVEGVCKNLLDDPIIAGIVINIADVTERKRAETALRQSEAHYRAIVEDQTELIWRFLPNGRPTFVNEAYCRYFDKSYEEIVNQGFTPLIFEEDKEIVEAHLTALCQGQDVKMLEHRVITPKWGGEIRWLQWQHRAIVDEQDQIVEFQGVGRDITERKRAEQILHEQQQLLQGIIDNTMAIIYIKDLAGCYLLVNNRFETVSKLDREEIIGKRDSDIFPPEIAHHLQANDKIMLQAGKAQYFDEIIPHEYGLRTYISVKFPLFDAQGQSYAIACISTDITDRKRVENALEQMTQRYRSLFEQAPAMYVITHDRDGVPIVIDANERFLNALGYSWAEVQERPLDEFYTAQSRARILKGGERPPMTVGQFVAEECELVNRNGKVIQTMLQSAPEFNFEGQVIGSREMYVDISKLKQLQERLAAIHQLGRELTLLRDEAAIVQQVLETARLVLRCTCTACGLVDAARNELAYRYHFSEGVLEPMQLRLSLDEQDANGIGVAVVSQGQGINVPDISQDPRYAATEKEWTNRSELCVPMKVGERIIGVLNAESTQTRHFTPDDQRILQILADQTAVALENAWLLAETERHARELTALNKAGRDMAASLDLDTVLEHVLSEAKVMLGAEGASALLYDSTSNELIFTAAASPGADMMIGMRLPLTVGIAGWVATERQAILIEDAQQDERFYKAVDTATGLTTRSLIAVPLVNKGALIGVIESINKAQEPFNQHDLELLEALISSAVIAIENARLHAETSRRLHEQIILRQMGVIISATLDLETVLNNIVEQLCIVTDTTSAYISNYNPQEKSLTVVAEYVSDQANSLEWVSDLKATYDLTQEFPSMLEVLRSGQSQVAHIDDPDLDETKREHLGQYGGQTVLEIPMQIAGQTIACASLWESRRRRVFSADEIALCQNIAQQAVVAIENARLHAETERRAKQLSVLHELDQAITAYLNIEDVYDAFAHHTIRLLPYDCMSITLVEADQLRVTYVVDQTSATLTKDTLLPLQDSAVGWVIAHGRPLLRHNLAKEIRFSEDKMVAAKGVRSVLLLPLRVKRQTIGTWNIGSQQENAYSQDDLQIAQAMVDQLAIAIENARLFEAEQVQRRRTEALQAAGAAISSTLDLGQVLDRLLVELGQVIPYDSASVFLLEDEHLRITIARSLPDSNPIGKRFEPNELARVVEQTRQPLILADARKDPRFQRWKGATHVRGWMSIPLLARDQFIGHITLDNRRPAAYSQTDAELALSFANQAAMAVENARLYQNLQKQMRTLQETQSQLLQSEKMAALGRLSASIAHEINNPLQAIRSGLFLFKEKIRDNPHAEQLQHYLIVAEQEIDRISTIMRRMRNFYPSSGNGEQPSPLNLDLMSDFYRASTQDLQPVDLQVMLETELRLFEKQLDQKMVTVECHWSANLPSIQGNPDHLRQVFLNLILNATEAMTSQGGTLYISTNPDQIRLADGQLIPAVCLAISDTGPGLPTEDLEQLFEPFFSTKENGSGLGLFISRKIVEAHHGKISVECHADLGTTFSIILPVEPS